MKELLYSILDIWHKSKEFDVIVKKHHQRVFYAEPPVDGIKFRIHVAKSPQKLLMVLEIFNNADDDFLKIPLQTLQMMNLETNMANYLIRNWRIL